MNQNEPFDYYEEQRYDPNNFSRWFPKIKNCGINVPRSVVIPVPEDVNKCFFMENKNDQDKIAAWIKKEVMPLINDFPELIFVKNGGFSNKFNYKSCAIRKNFYELVAAVTEINYASLCLDTGGDTELVIRERVGCMEEGELFHIYNGMPLRPEFRVFYDFDRRKAHYIVNYWDWDYCFNTISKHDKTDGVAFISAYPDLIKFYDSHKDEVLSIIETHMQNVDMTGIWSVDIMYADEKYWLIDMALGYRSAYYDSRKCGYIVMKEA